MSDTTAGKAPSATVPPESATNEEERPSTDAATSGDEPDDDSPAASGGQAEATAAEDGSEPDAPPVASNPEEATDAEASGAEAAGDAAGDGEADAEAEADEAELPESARRFVEARDQGKSLEGRVIGWNRGGFHVVIGDTTAFCPRSEMEIREPRSPKGYVDQTYDFRVLRVEDRGRRVVVSRARALEKAKTRKAKQALQNLEVGARVTGTVASLVDFGAFVELGGVRGLVHVSEISHAQVDHPQDVLEVGQEVEVEVLKIQQGGKRISLSMKALEPDPWERVEERFAEGASVTGTVERVAPFGAFVELAPGLTGLLPTSEMKIPREASPARVFPPGKEVDVHVLSIDRRRKRISLGLEGSTVEGTKADFKRFKEQQEESSGFNALAAALEKLR